MTPPVDPILIHLGPNFGIHWYGLLITTGMVLGAAYAAWRAKVDEENPEHVWNSLVLTAIFAIVGARLYHAFSSPRGGGIGWAYYRQHPIEILYVWQGGLGIYGAIVGGGLGLLIYARRAGLRPLQWLDYAAPGLAIGQAIGRWGNFINQELYGPPTELGWGLIIDAEHRIAPYDNLAQYPLDTLFHPTFLYESIWCFLLFGMLAFVAHKGKAWLLEGDIVMGYLIGYPLGRFLIEYLRPDAWTIGPLAAAQWFALGSICVGVGGIIWRHTRSPASGSSDPIAEQGASS